MPIHAVEARAWGVRLWPSSNVSYERTETQIRALFPAGVLEQELTEAQIRRNKNRIAERMTQELQRTLEVRISLTDPRLADDPAGLVDPGLPGFFWDLATQELVARPVLVTITWDVDRATFVPELRKL